MKKNICIVTGSRAEFGLLCPLINEIKKSKLFKLSLVVTGSHLDKSFGNTIQEINEKELSISETINLPLNFNNNNDGMAKVTSVAIDKFSSYFNNHRPDFLVVLGDRYEIFGVCIAASMMKIPIVHIAGGETTQGAVDEFIRHSITKMSYLHFVSCEEYRKRIIQLGESPNRVFNVGSLSADNIKAIKTNYYSLVLKNLNIDSKTKYCLVTYHPETLNRNDVKVQMKELILALSQNNDMNYIITKANADFGGNSINEMWDKEIKKHINWRLVSSLGFENYLSLMSHCQMVIGNSSSGVIETPIMKKPTINIGDRQKGRYMAKSVINCKCNSKEITRAMKKACSKSFLDSIKDIDNPFGNGNTSKKTVKILEKELKKDISLKKEFYDIKF